jgi:hypothetical protein
MELIKIKDLLRNKNVKVWARYLSVIANAESIYTCTYLMNMPIDYNNSGIVIVMNKLSHCREEILTTGLMVLVDHMSLALE